MRLERREKQASSVLILIFIMIPQMVAGTCQETKFGQPGSEVLALSEGQDQMICSQGPDTRFLGSVFYQPRLISIMAICMKDGSASYPSLMFRCDDSPDAICRSPVRPSNRSQKQPHESENLPILLMHCNCSTFYHIMQKILKIQATL